MRHVLAFVLGIALLGGSSVSAQMSNDAYDKVEKGLVFQTIGNTPTVIYSLPVEEYKVVFAEAFISAIEHTFAFGAVGKVEALFARSNGNLGQFSTTRADLIANTFALPIPA